MRFNLRIPDAKSEARHQERVADERRKLREKNAEREERRAAGPRVPKGTVNVNTLGMKVMMHIDASARPDVALRARDSVHDAVARAAEPIVYISPTEAFVVLTPPAPKFQLGMTITLVIVRGPKPFRRAVASVTVGEHGNSTDVQLPSEADWIETEAGDVIYDYARELATYETALAKGPQAPTPATSPPASGAIVSARSPVSEATAADDANAARRRISAIRDLAALRDAGDLTQAEFDAEKARILAS